MGISSIYLSNPALHFIPFHSISQDLNAAYLT